MDSHVSSLNVLSGEFDAALALGAFRGWQAVAAPRRGPQTASGLGTDITAFFSGPWTQECSLVVSQIASVILCTGLTRSCYLSLLERSFGTRAFFHPEQSANPQLNSTTPLRKSSWVTALVEKRNCNKFRCYVLLPNPIWIIAFFERRESRSSSSNSYSRAKLPLLVDIVSLPARSLGLTYCGVIRGSQPSTTPG